MSDAARGVQVNILRGQTFTRKSTGDKEYLLLGIVPNFDEDVSMPAD